MRRTIRSVGVVFVAMLGAIGLAIGSAFAAALAFGATALIVPGTGTHNIDGPNAVRGYKENAADRFIDVSGQKCSSTDKCDLVGIDYPASFFPLGFIPGWCPGFSCDTWNTSVGTGVANLDDALQTTLKNTSDPIILFGYSQGGAVVSQEMYNVAEADKSRISVVTIGNINNPLGLWSRLSFLPTIPLLNISFNPQLPTDDGIKSTNYSFEYDPVGDAPQYWGNPLAVLNAFVALEYVHGNYLAPNSNYPSEGLPYGYDDGTLASTIANAPHRTYGDATFVLIPQQGAMPLYQPIVDAGNKLGISGLVNPLVALVNPVTKLLVDLGYDRVTNPGIARTLSILPFNPFTLNPIDFSVKFVAAIAQGIRDALAGGVSLVPPTTTTTTTTTNTPVSSLVTARSIAPQTVDPVEKKVAAKIDAKVEANKTAPEVVNVAAGGAETQPADDTDQDAAAALAEAKVKADKETADARDASEAKAAAEVKAAKEEKAEKDAAAADAAAKAAADKAKEAADSAKANGAAGDGATKSVDAKTEGSDASGGTSATASSAGGTDSEKKAA